MEILLGTTNPSKVGYFERVLEGLDVSFVTLRDLGITDEPEECGATPEENARIKAAFYHRYAPQDAVICADSGLYFDALPLDDPRPAAEERLALVMGTEGDGLPEATIARCHYTLRIPMAHGVDSLNVAAAAAVACWQLRLQRA